MEIFIYGCVLIIAFIVYRQFRYQKIKSKISEAALVKLGKISKHAPKKNNHHRNELIADSAQHIGVACYNYLSLAHSHSILKGSEVSDSLQESVLFTALERRYSDLDTNGVIEKFHQHLSNETLFKGDIGEEVMAQTRMAEGHVVSFPTNADGSWKSNNEAYDYTIEKDGVILKENPKVGYDNNFSTIKDQAIENPDVHYIVGPQHAESIKNSGLENISTNLALENGNIQTHISELQSKIADISVESAESSMDVFDFPLFAVAYNSASQMELIKNGDVGYGEAALNVAVKAGVRWGGAKGGLVAGAKIGGILGGPVGVVLGTAIGGLAGSTFASKIYKAWKSEVICKSYAQNLSTLVSLGEFALQEIPVKLHQVEHYEKDIKSWFRSHLFQVLFPTENYVLKRETLQFCKKYISDLGQIESTIKQEIPQINELKVALTKTGFLDRIFGSLEKKEKMAIEKSFAMLQEIQKIGIIRTSTLNDHVQKWQSEMDTIKSEKRKIAA